MIVNIGTENSQMGLDDGNVFIWKRREIVLLMAHHNNEEKNKLYICKIGKT